MMLRCVVPIGTRTSYALTLEANAGESSTSAPSVRGSCASTCGDDEEEEEEEEEEGDRQIAASNEARRKSSARTIRSDRRATEGRSDLDLGATRAIEREEARERERERERERRAHVEEV
eukprot:30629-Pelagococcus_subviridis.AAC.2